MRFTAASCWKTPPESELPSSSHRERTPGSLHGRTRCDRVVPSFEVRIILQTDVVDAVQMHVGIHGHVGDRISAPEIFVFGEMPIEDAKHVAQIGLKMLLRARHLAGRTYRPMSELLRERGDRR